MGGGSEQPYLYTPDRTVYPYSNFNPKAVTQASIQQAEESRRPRPKQNGPLINFNAHPDSWMINDQQRQGTYKPMPRRTKTEVTVIRWIQFALRILEELGALGLLVCVICIKGIDVSWSWMMRIAPAWDAVITLYAIYHLVRPANARTPASSASYHMFAIFMDVGLLPFFIFTSLFARNNYLQQPSNKDRWTSFFTEPGATTTLLLSTFLISATLAGLHVFSTVFDLWLIVLFRRIAKLPPDVNPLEESNLTARPSKHKYKNSDATLVDSLTEKKPGYYSGSTMTVDHQSRLSTATNPDGGDHEYRKVPFYHSRNQSQVAFSPHNPNTARMSRQQFEDVNLYQQSPSSQADAFNYARPHSLSPSKRGPTVEYTEVFDPTREPTLPNVAPPQNMLKTQQQQSLLNNDNWFSIGEDDGASDLGTPNRHIQPIPTLQIDRYASMDYQPLRMNPPTPPPPQSASYEEDDKLTGLQEARPALSERQDDGNGNLAVGRSDTNSSSVYSESAPELKPSRSLNSNGTPKGKYYGDLASAMRGVRSSPNNNNNGNANAGAGPYGNGAPSLPKKNSKRNGGGRVVSRTGADYVDSSQPQAYGTGGGYSILNRREVSGKIAEEGRSGGAGAWWGRKSYY